MKAIRRLDPGPQHVRDLARDRRLPALRDHQARRRSTKQFVEGAKEGFQLVVRIIPYMVGILFAMAMFRASGAMDFLIERPAPDPRAWSASRRRFCRWRSRGRSPAAGSIGVLADMIKTYGMDSIYVKMAAVIFGSSETTFYVIAVYFGSVNVTKVRHAVLAGPGRARARRSSRRFTCVEMMWGQAAR